VVSGGLNVGTLRAQAHPDSERGGWRVNVDFERIDAR
jgi:hypothetical protein